MSAPFYKERGIPASAALTDNGFNTERPHLGCRDMGKRPIDTVNAYLTVTQEAS